MLSSFNDLLNTTTTTEIMSVSTFMLLIVVAMVLGIVFSLAMQFRSYVSKSFSVTLALLPPVVAVVIMMVNGSIGTGIAVAGTFSLVRFRSVPGTAREIVAVFIAMAIGLSCGMGEPLYALFFIIITMIGLLALENSKFGEFRDTSKQKMLRITIPEDLDYTEIFFDLFEEYTASHKLLTVKTTNLGSMFKLTYEIELKDLYEEKEFIDQLRVRNGNLEISCSLMSNLISDL